MKLRQAFFCLLALSAGSALAITAAAQNTPRPDASGPRDIDLTAQDGTKLKATYYAAAKPGPGIMLLHQCNREGRGTWTNLAAQLAARGFHVMTLDYRGYGESGGERVANITPQERRRWVNETWPADIDIAFDALLKQPGVNREFIAAAGASCGAGQSIQFARRHSNVKTIALLSGGTGASNQDRDYLEYAGWMPLLMAASRDDGGIVPSMRWLMGFSGNPQNKFLEYQAAGHGTDMFAVEKGLEPAIVEWFDLHLRRSPVQRTSASAAARAPLGPSAAFWKLLEEPGGAARAHKIFDEAKKKDPAVILFPEAEMNALG
ncbi:MAG: alpha/beta fold hydrolase, partial [Candidatus Acidiferrales bacterium]